MLPIPTRSVFRNRWWSLAWAAGICWTAIDVAGGFKAKDPASAVDANAVDPTAGAGNGADQDAAADHGRAQLDALVNSIL